eukprot:m.626434 g.626434  ORF g.626434 m.626434 type:complete len:259 (-) comp22553_c0_seq14:2419-3195(-)
MPSTTELLDSAILLAQHAVRDDRGNRLIAALKNYEDAATILRTLALNEPDAKKASIFGTKADTYVRRAHDIQSSPKYQEQLERLEAAQVASAIRQTDPPVASSAKRVSRANSVTDTKEIQGDRLFRQARDEHEDLRYHRALALYEQSASKFMSALQEATEAQKPAIRRKAEAALSAAETLKKANWRQFEPKRARPVNSVASSVIPHISANNILHVFAILLVHCMGLGIILVCCLLNHCHSQRVRCLVPTFSVRRDIIF